MFIGHECPDCPPADASYMPGTYYRFVVKTFDNAFISRFKLGLAVQNTCEENAISLIVDKAAVAKKRTLHPRAFQKAGLAEVVISDSSHGVLKQDNATHSNWWHPLEFDFKTVATLIEERS